MSETKVALVIGAGDSTGGAVARRFAREGCRVASWDVQEAPPEEGGIFQKVDVASGSSVAWALDDLGAAYPALRHPGNAAFVQTLPSRDDTTGFFIARLRRVA